MKMKSFALRIFLLLVPLTLSACAYTEDFQHRMDDTLADFHAVTPPVHRSLAAYDRIQVHAPVDLILVSHDSPEYHFDAVNDGIIFPQLSITVRNHTLNIHASSNMNTGPQRPLIRLHLGELNHLQYSGNGNIRGRIRSRHLTMALRNTGWVRLVGRAINLQKLTAHNVGSIRIQTISSPDLYVFADNVHVLQLFGVMRLNHLIYNGDGEVQIGWINGKHVIVRAEGSGKIYLAGNAALLNASINGTTYLNAKYLNTQRAFINTGDHARTDVIVHQTLNAFASDVSDIYYYLRPSLLNRYMRGRGAILYMPEEIPPCTMPICAPVPAYAG